MNTKAIELESMDYYLNLKYPVTIHAAPEGGFVAEIEDLPGCLAQGETLEEVFNEIENWPKKIHPQTMSAKEDR
jgi:antitoxin HicB